MGRRGEIVGTYDYSETGLRALAEFQRSSGTIWRRLDVGFRLSEADCFVRQVQLPATVRSRLEEVLRLDLVRTTPFDLDEIYTDFSSDEDPRDWRKINVTQCVVKRTILDDHIHRLSAAGIEVQFVDVWSADLSGGRPVNFLAATSRSRKRPDAEVRFRRTAFVAIAGLICLAAYLGLERQERALQELRDAGKIAKERSFKVVRAQRGARQQEELVNALKRAKATRYTVIESWNELTRLLPDTAWITEFQISDDKIQISGYAKSAADLVGIFERSSLFEATELTSLVSFDSRFNKERFSLATKLRQRQPRAGRQRGGRHQS